MRVFFKRYKPIKIKQSINDKNAKRHYQVMFGRKEEKPSIKKKVKLPNPKKRI